MDERCEEDKLAELKEMLIRVKILKTKSKGDWKEYRKRNDKEWIEREGLAILLTEEAIDLMVNKGEDEVWKVFDEFLLITSADAVQGLLVQLCTSVSDCVGRDGNGWKGHRVLCWILGWMVKEWEVEWSDETIESLVDYLVKVLECEDMEMVKWAILTGERWWMEMEMKMNSEETDRLRTALTLHSTQTQDDTLERAIDRDCWDPERYQVEWCARWCENIFLQTEIEKIPCIKLSRERFEIRCDWENMIEFEFSPVRSAFSFKSNAYYYEVICIQNGAIQVGWTTRETHLDEPWRTNKNKPCVVLQIGDKCNIQHNKHIHKIRTLPHLHSFNVIGCLLDVDNQRFEFYINGRALECPTSSHILPQPYYATALISPHQHCHFNFGQSPFKFPPRNVRFTTFDEQTGGDESKYRLMVAQWCDDDCDYWFANTPADNQVSLFFDDEIQNEVNRKVRIVEGDIENYENIWEWRWDEEMEEGLRVVRYIQAIVEVMGTVDKMDVMAQWVGKVIEDMIDEVYGVKLLEMLHPYLHLVHTESTLTQHRSISIVLLHLIKCHRHHGYNIIPHIHSSVFTYLTRTLTSSSDHWTQLFVLIALTDLQLSEDEEIIAGQMADKWRSKFEGRNVGQWIMLGQEYKFQCQLYICSQKLHNSITINSTNSHELSSATLNPHDLTPQLTLSPCHLSARSDWHWQSVRSVCQVSAHIYYFEVVLLTDGPMTLGWTTTRTDLTKITKIHPKGTTPIMVGFDEFCIGFDGFNRCIYHDNKTFQLENIPRWKAGDIVGCLIDKPQSFFQFYLNGIQINFSPNKCPIFFSSQPYHSLLSLSQFQQVYLNFGQSPFSSHRPKYIDFRDFYSEKPEVNEIQTKTVLNFNNANLERNLIITDSNFKNRDIKISGNASKSKRCAVVSSESIGNISSVHTIANVNVEEVNNSQIKRSRMECRLCCSTSTTKLVRFVCCKMFPLCLDCLRVMTECPKCKKQTNDPQTDENQPKQSKQIQHCTLCSKQRASFRFITCDHFKLCQTCVNLVLFKDCPKCN